MGDSVFTCKMTFLRGAVPKVHPLIMKFFLRRKTLYVQTWKCGALTTECLLSV